MTDTAKVVAESKTDWETVIGLEVHCELRTATKLFCSCKNEFGSEPNTNVCPVCLGLPGSLPVLNEMAVQYAMRIGAALNCTISPSTFSRKNYFYPDMPKDYQVTQYDLPINLSGSIELPGGKVVRIERAHMEEDTGKTTHMGGAGRIHDAAYSLVDYNRAGVPLVEIVSAPDVESAEQARSYVSELRAILVATGASDGRMEEGSLRVDANVSVRRRGAAEYGTRCEIKNMNSLRSLGRAIDYEVSRQIALIESGGRVIQETRHWNEDSGKTSSMRSKEEANDYRYFPEPDLVPIAPDAAAIESVISALPPMPAARRKKVASLVSGATSTDQIVTIVELGLDDLVVGAIDLGADPRLALARAANEAARNPEKARVLSPKQFAALVDLEQKGSITATQSKTVLEELLANGGEPAAIATKLGFEALGDDVTDKAVDEVIAGNPAEWERFREGDEKVAQFLLGQVMRATKGRANGKAVAAAFAARRDAK